MSKTATPPVTPPRNLEETNDRLRALGLPPFPSAQEWRERVQRLEEAFTRWDAEDDEDESAWIEFKEAMNRNRLEVGAEPLYVD